MRHDQSPNRLVLDWAIEQARKRRDRGTLRSIERRARGQPCLHANDARGARYWVPLATAENTVALQGLTTLQHHIGKPIAVFPNGGLVAVLRDIPSTPDIQLCPQAYRPMLSSSLGPTTTTIRPKLAPSSHLKRLEAESIQIIREAVAEAENPVMMYSIGKDSGVMLHLARKAFYPAPPPFPLLHVDTRWKFQEMYLFRDFMARESGMELLVHTNPEAIEKEHQPLRPRFCPAHRHHQDRRPQAGARSATNSTWSLAARDAMKKNPAPRSACSHFARATHRWDPKKPASRAMEPLQHPQEPR